MSKATDEIDNAVEHIEAALKHLANITVERCDGTGSLTDVWKQRVNESFTELIVIRDRLVD